MFNARRLEEITHAAAVIVHSSWEYEGGKGVWVYFLGLIGKFIGEGRGEA